MSAPQAPVERELKLMLTREGYETIESWAIAQGQDVTPTTQVNVYFDTPDRHLQAAGVMIRVRRKGGRYVLTLKIRREAEAPGVHATEVEEELDDGVGVAALSAQTLPGLEDTAPLRALYKEAERQELSVEPLVRQGTLTTHRARLEGPGGLPIELDHSEYAGVEDYELECETDDTEAARAAIEPWLEELGVSYEPSALPKVARLFDELDALP